MPTNQFQRMVFAFIVCYNFPFAYFSQLFFIQPFVRTLFKFIFKKQLQKEPQTV